MENINVLFGCTNWFISRLSLADLECDLKLPNAMKVWNENEVKRKVEAG